MSFFDETQQRPGRSRRPPPQRGRATDRQTLIFRRVLAAGIAFVVLLLIVLGVKSCRDSARRDSMKTYVRDVAAITQASGQDSSALFTVLSRSGKQSPLQLQNAVNQYEGDAAQLVDRAKHTGHPDEMSNAHRYLVQVLQLRRNALGTIASSLQPALGATGSDAATARIAAQMETLLASDVVYREQVVPNLRRPLKKEGLLNDVTIPKSHFLPDLQWVRPTVVASHIEGLRTGRGAGPVTPGVHGTSLVGTTARPGGQSLTSGGTTSITVTPKLSFDVTVQNGGVNKETDVQVVLTVAGAGKPIVREQTIPTMDAGQQKIVSIPLAATPPTGRRLTVSVDVKPVPGETKTDNNKGTYGVIFTH